MQYLFLNGRYIRDRSLQHALGEAYRGLLMVGRMPVCFLHVDVDPKTVDVNVHPTKVEVRFEDSGAIYSRLLHSLRTKFLSSDMVARVRTPSAPEPTFADAMTPTITSHSVSSSAGLLDWAKSNNMVSMAPVSLGGALPDFRPYPNNGLSGFANASPVGGSPRTSSRVDDPFYSPPDLHPVSGRIGSFHASPGQALLEKEQSADADIEFNVPSDLDSSATGIDRRNREFEGAAKLVGFQIHNRYLVTQDQSGMVLIDQHALHERILYEQIKNKVLSKTMEKQPLLVPETVTLSPSEAAAAIESKEMLAEIGIDVEPFGGDTVLVSSYPAMLGKMGCAEILREVLEPLMSGGKKVDARNLLDELMNMMACKAAVKAGDKLSPDEITSLLQQREHYQDTHHCPHGRPTALFFSREQLDKMFKRI